MERNNNPKHIGDIGVSIVFFVSVTKNKVPGETGRAPGPGPGSGSRLKYRSNKQASDCVEIFFSDTNNCNLVHKILLYKF